MVAEAGYTQPSTLPRCRRQGRRELQVDHVAAGAGTVWLGVAMFLAPGRMGRGWFGEAADHPATQLAVRGLAVRDLALGIGAAQALVREGDTTRWTHAGMLADTGDAAATLLARRHLSTASVVGVVALAGGAAAAGAWSQLRA